MDDGEHGSVRPEPLSLPGYEVGELIGFGATGEVWRARERASGVTVALKRLRPASTALPEERLHREAALLASVRHEHIVRLRGVAATASGPVLVLDFAAGGSLASLLAVRHKLSPGEVVTIGAPLAQALADIHGRALTHGDVSTANVLFSAEGKPMLADLGIARLVGEEAGAGAHAGEFGSAGAVAGGTRGYTDPAAMLPGTGVARATPAGDVHGLAAVCFAALAGTPPYRDIGDPGGLARLELRPLAANAPRSLVEAIERGLAADPRDRPDAAAFARLLFAACTATPVRLVGAPRLVQSPVTQEAARPGVVDAPAQLRAALAPVHPRRPSSSSGSAAGRSHRRRLGASVLVRRVAAAAGAAGLVAVAVSVGVVWAARERASDAAVGAAPPPAAAAVTSSRLAEPPATPAGSAPGAGSPARSAPGGDWAAVLGALDALRDAAFNDGRPADLDEVYLPSSAALAADRTTLGTLVAAGEHAQGLALRVESATVSANSPDQVSLDVRDVLPGYALVKDDGSVLAQPGRGERRWTIVLRRAAAGWRIATIDAVG